MDNIYRYLSLLLISTIIIRARAQDATDSYKSGRKRFICPNETEVPDCSCEKYATESLFYCPDFNPTLTVRIVNDQVRTECSTSDPYDFQSIRNLQIGTVDVLRVVDCPLDEDQPILETFRFLGIPSVGSLMYVNYKQPVTYNARYFEGLDRLENLTLTLNVASIDRDTFSVIPNLRRLFIERNTNLELQPGTFRALKNLSSLVLTSNYISQLKPGFFEGQENLLELSLAFNKIKSLGRASFEGLKSLQRINLGSNILETIETDAFTTLAELTRLELSFNAIVSLPKGLFEGNRKLQTVILSNNRKFSSLPDDFLANLPMLNNVILHHTGIKDIPESLFSGSASITDIDLSYNKLESVPEGLLRDQKLLETLNLSHNRLGEIPEYIFEANKQLETLHLSHNHLERLAEELFASLKSLKTLYLENNNLKTIPQFIFIGLQNLEELSMQNNQLAWHGHSFKSPELSVAENDNTPFQYLVKLRVLSLQNNSIETIFQDFHLNTLYLEKLDLSFNELSQLSDLDLQFQSNISLNLSSNKISKITLQGLSFNSGLKINVDLGKNPLNCDCQALDFVQQVQKPETNEAIQFATDKLWCVEPRSLLNIPVEQIQPKDLVCEVESDCPKECHCTKRSLDKTVVVNCSGRELPTIPVLPIPSKIDEEYNTIELHVENNLLTELPHVDKTGYSAVTQLYAKNNSIRELLPQNIPPNLHLMDLSQNCLQEIDDSTLEFLNRSDHLKTLLLSGNQWQCGCPASRFLNFVQQNSRLVADISEVRCNATGKSFDSVTVNELCYEDYTLQLVLCFAVALLGVLVGLISLLFFRYQTEVKVWLFTHNLFLSFITEEELDKDKMYDAFISYSHLDEDFITDELIPKLENEPMNFKTCWHVRDFMPGEMIMTQIVKSIEASRRTVIVLSKNFLESSWAKHEFRQAHVQSMEDNRVRVIVVIYEDIGDIEGLDSELKAYLKTNTYVKWGDPWFWQKLRYAMPHPLRIKGLKSAVSEIHLQEVTTKPTPKAV